MGDNIHAELVGRREGRAQSATGTEDSTPGIVTTSALPRHTEDRTAIAAAPLGTVALDPGVALAAVFDGPRLLDPETGQLLAALGDDGTWRTAEGVESIGLVLPVQRCTAGTTAQAREEFTRIIDADWQREAMEVVRSVAVELPEFTTDKVSERLKREPREPRLYGPLMLACEREGIIVRTEEFRPSTRGINHHRRQRVWRSRLMAAPQLFDTSERADVRPADLTGEQGAQI